MKRLQDIVAQNPLKCFVADRWPESRRRLEASRREFLELETAAPDRIREYQTGRLRRLLAAAARSPYYRTVLGDLAVDPTTFELDDLPRLPLLSKDALRNIGPGLRIAGASGVRENHSGGSTGVPIRFWQDSICRADMDAATKIANQRAGIFPGARVAKLWGAPQDRRLIEGWRGRARLWLLNMRYYDTFDIGIQRMESYHRSMADFQPDFIQAYASSAYLLAEHLRSRDIRPDYPRCAIVTSAERLLPHMRQTIEAVFGVPVFDRYGSREASAIASECAQHRGLHIHMPGYILETIDPRTGKPVEGEHGEIVITALSNFAMPMIRYRIGDMGRIERGDCSCGRSLDRLSELTGRTSDNFVMSDGRLVHGEYFTHAFYGRAGIAQFQFVQESLDRFVLRIVPAAGYRPEETDRIENEIRHALPPAAELRIELREQIPVAASGKYRFTISHVDAAAVVAGEGLPGGKP
ncbi:MAG: hypothetical protein R2729_08160 [Bryobacteraceae bacterium]